jgi:hypothetical protein
MLIGFKPLFHFRLNHKNNQKSLKEKNRKFKKNLKKQKINICRGKDIERFTSHKWKRQKLR